jgi:glycerol kinase
MVKDSGLKLKELRVDGGASNNDLLMQFQADLLNVRIDRPRMVETTAIGAAFLAGLGVGYWKNSSEIQRIRRTDRVFKPRMKDALRKELWAGWKEAVERVLTNE